MATPQAIATGAECFSCIPDKWAALIYLLATNAGVTDPQTISTASECYTCIPDKLAAILYLLDNGGGGGGGGGTGDIIALTGTNVPAAAPSSGKGIAYNEAGSMWTWDTTALSWTPIL